jgi:hypothetical protein
MATKMTEQERMETLHVIYEEELEELKEMETEAIRDLAKGYVDKASRVMLMQVVTDLRQDFWW